MRKEGHAHHWLDLWHPGVTRERGYLVRGLPISYEKLSYKGTMER